MGVCVDNVFMKALGKKEKKMRDVIGFTEAELMSILSWYDSAHRFANHNIVCREDVCKSAKATILILLNKRRKFQAFVPMTKDEYKEKLEKTRLVFSERIHKEKMNLRQEYDGLIRENQSLRDRLKKLEEKKDG